MQNIENKTLEYSILSILSKGYCTGKELLSKLEEARVGFDFSKFFPILSKLTLSNLLCSNWSTSKLGLNEKYYYLTGRGEKYLREINTVANVLF